jgi:ABC-type Fe3+-hydroxamate transport system substrate-binding protein
MKHAINRLSPLRPALLWPLLLILSCLPEKHAAVPAGPIARIVSLSPSISREIVDLGAGGLLVGVTSYDDVRGRGIKVIGTLVQPNLETIVMLRPDIVFYSGEDGLVQNIGRISGAGVATHRFGRNRNFNDICGNYTALAGMLGRLPAAQKKVNGYREILDRLKKRGRAAEPPLVVFLISCTPLIAASADSFIGQIIGDAGGRCAYGGAGRPHPMVSMESLVQTDPDVIIAMTGGDDVDDFFRRLSRDFKDLAAVSHGNMHAISPDTIPFYTPSDYVKSVERISYILEKSLTGARLPPR